MRIGIVEFIIWLVLAFFVGIATVEYAVNRECGDHGGITLMIFDNIKCEVIK